jgi:hypothetical protein
MPTQLPLNAEPPPFDNRITIEMDDGTFVRFITDPLAHAYIHEPNGLYRPGMLPPSELELRHAVNELKDALLYVSSFNAIGRTLLRGRYNFAQRRLQTIVDHIAHLVRSSHEHKAALRRIASTMPKGTFGHKLLSQFLQH